ncbi:hypothetical protein [Aliivibrio fischeri]|uniref:Uncharacterized protein n=1 Tax=Aliivibrio fischeri SR5 TaxID=1088719 RepID=A0AAV3ENK1_ALIFS|nr:hypothetical protein [Aliivibrio fischeri]EHN68425.1 hypothetical protein VFSR5_A1010 [Aliivibrio fischeri SR5]OED51361.1 hypothetical protein BEI47_10440 [Aliivibrio fischeri]
MKENEIFIKNNLLKDMSYSDILIYHLENDLSLIKRSPDDNKLSYLELSLENIKSKIDFLKKI